MESHRFQLFDFPHLVVLALTVILFVLLGVLARRGGPEAGRRIRLGLAALLVFNKLALVAYSWQLGRLSLYNILPMHLCDWATVVTVLALITLRPRLFELAYFWGLGATLQALLTPDLPFGFPDFYFFSFFTSHCGIIVAVGVLVIGSGMRVTWKSMLRAVLWTQVYVVSAMSLNAMAGTNYGYLMRKPANASLMDHLAPWPWYILQLELIMLAVFGILLLPFIFPGRLRKPKIPTIEQP